MLFYQNWNFIIGTVIFLFFVLQFIYIKNKLFCWIKELIKQGLYLARGKPWSQFSTTKLSGTRRPRTQARILFRAVSVPCGQQGSRQYLCRRNCPPTSKGVSKRINFTWRCEKGVNIWNGYPSSVTLLFGRCDRVKDVSRLDVLFNFAHHVICRIIVSKLQQ